VALGDRQSGKVLGVAFWESEEALRATEQAVLDVRSGAAGAADGIVAGVEEYEVLVNEAPSAGPLDAVTGTVGGVTDTVGGATQPVSGATDTVGGVTDTLGGTTGGLLGAGRRRASEGRPPHHRREERRGPGRRTPALFVAPIHPSAWKGRSANFATPSSP
jgi:hypothetical protein